MFYTIKAYNSLTDSIDKNLHNGQLVYVKNNNLYKVVNTDFSSVNTVQEAIDNGNLVPFIDGTMFDNIEANKFVVTDNNGKITTDPNIKYNSNGAAFFIDGTQLDSNYAPVVLYGSNNNYVLKIFTQSNLISFKDDGKVNIGYEGNSTLNVGGSAYFKTALPYITLEDNNSNTYWRIGYLGGSKNIYFSQNGDRFIFDSGNDDNKVNFIITPTAEYNFPNATKYCSYINKGTAFSLLPSFDTNHRDDLINKWQNDYNNNNKDNVAPGLLFYNTDLNKYQYFNGSRWVNWNILDIEGDKGYVLLTDGNENVETSKNYNTYFKYDAENNKLLIGDVDSNYQTINIVGDNPSLVLAHNQHNAGGAFIGFSTSLGNTRYPHTAIGCAYNGGSGDNEIRIYGATGSDSAPLDFNYYALAFRPQLDRTVLRGRDLQLLGRTGTTDVKITSTHANQEDVALSFKLASETKIRWYAEHTGSYGRGYLHLVQNNEANGYIPTGTNNNDVVISASPDKKVGIRNRRPQTVLDINGAIRINGNAEALEDLGSIKKEDAFDVLAYREKRWHSITNQFKINTYTIYRLGSDTFNINNQIYLGRYVYPNKSLFKVYVNGTLLTESDWDFISHTPVGQSTDYVSHIKFNNITFNSNDKIIVEYDEYTTGNNFYTLGLRHSNKKLNSKKITQTITDSNGNNYYLKEVNITDKFYIECTYRDFNIFGQDDRIVKKCFANELYIKEFPFNETFVENYILEIWSTSALKALNKYQNNPRTLAEKSKGHWIPHKELSKNRFIIEHPGVYKFRFRFTINNIPMFTDWFINTLDVRKFDIFTTNSSLSSKNYEGFYYWAKIK